MLTLPSRSQSTDRSSRRLSNGSTSMECRGLMPSGARCARPARPTTATSAAAASAAAPIHQPRRDRGAAGISRSPASAWRNSSPVCHRSEGCFSRARITAAASRGGVSGRDLLTGTGGSAMCLDTTTRLVPVNGGRPVSISYATTPSAYRSLRPSISSPAACSGLMYVGVPTATPWPVLNAVGSPATARAMPKSASSARPVPCSMSTFSGFTSR